MCMNRVSALVAFQPLCRPPNFCSIVVNEGIIEIRVPSFRANTCYMWISWDKTSIALAFTFT